MNIDDCFISTVFRVKMRWGMVIPIDGNDDSKETADNQHRGIVQDNFQFLKKPNAVCSACYAAAWVCFLQVQVSNAKETRYFTSFTCGNPLAAHTTRGSKAKQP